MKKGVKKVKAGKVGKEDKVILEIKKIAKDACLPEYMMASDIGLDIRANESVELMPGEQKVVRTGVVIKIPEGHVGLVRDRAGIVSKMNVHTAAGTFDPAYRGEFSIVLVNFSEETVEIEKGMRIAQLLIMPVTKVQVREVSKMDMTERGEKGFGSTGIREKIRELKKIKC